MGRSDRVLKAVNFLVLFLYFPATNAIWLNLPPAGTKCVSEEIQNNVVVLADYVVVSDDYSHSSTISVKVTSPYGNNLHHVENVTHGQFAFTTHEAGNYMACFWLDSNVHGHGGGKDVSVNIDWKIGIAAKDWDSVAKKEKIESESLHQFGELRNKSPDVRYASVFLGGMIPHGVELELRKLEGVVEAIHEKLVSLKSREADLRTVSETTNSRVAWFSIMSLGICVAVSVLQVLYLKQFFQKKKLI